MKLSHRTTQHSGFTIVELIVIIVVIGVLAGISIFGYGAWQKNTRTDQVKSDLIAAAAAMENAANFSNDYPEAVTSVFTPSDGVVLTGGKTATGFFCVSGESTKGAVGAYKITARSTTPLEGVCQPVTIANCGDDIFFQPFMRAIFIKLSCATGESQPITYKVEYRHDRSSGWEDVVLPEVGAEGWYYLQEAHPLVQSYSEDVGGTHGGAVRITASNAEGTSEPEVINYGAIQEG